ncbi:hypothetical protein M2146_001158 [Lachnospiraceae bacterium PF1-22]
MNTKTNFIQRVVTIFITEMRAAIIYFQKSTEKKGKMCSWSEKFKTLAYKIFFGAFTILFIMQLSVTRNLIIEITKEILRLFNFNSRKKIKETKKRAEAVMKIFMSIQVIALSYFLYISLGNICSQIPIGIVLMFSKKYILK